MSDQQRAAADERQLAQMAGDVPVSYATGIAHAVAKASLLILGLAAGAALGVLLALWFGLIELC